MWDQCDLMGLDQQVTLYLAILSHLIDILHVFDGLMILYACLCATAVHLDRVKMTIADPACQKSTADLRLGQQPMEVEVRELTVAYLLSLVNMRHTLLKIPIEGLYLQILVHLCHIHPKSQLLIDLLPDLTLYPQQAQQNITAQIAIILLLRLELPPVFFDLKADDLSLRVFLPSRLITEYSLLELSDMVIEKLGEIGHLLEQRHGYPLPTVMQNHQSFRLLHLIKIQLPQMLKLRSKFRLPQVLQHIQNYIQSEEQLMSDRQDSNDFKQDPNSQDMNEQNSEDKLNPYDTEQAYELYTQFIKDIEFVQMLADVEYLRQLHIRGYLYDQKFQEYLRGLNYLFQKQWLRLIRYPQGLWNLKDFLREGFIQSTKDPRNFQRFISHCTARNKAIISGYK